MNQIQACNALHRCLFPYLPVTWVLALSGKFYCEEDLAQFLPLLSIPYPSGGLWALLPVPGRLWVLGGCDHLRVIKQPLLPKAEPTGSKIIFPWNILLNWNALAVKKPLLTPEQIGLFFLKCRPCSTRGTRKGNWQIWLSNFSRP